MVDFREFIIERYSEEGEIWFADGLDSAIIGFEPNDFRVVYSRNLCVESCIAEGMNEEEAVDFLEYNTFNTYIGSGTPIWVDDFKYDMYE